jgi:hypothetical protein
VIHLRYPYKYLRDYVNTDLLNMLYHIKLCITNPYTYTHVSGSMQADTFAVASSTGSYPTKIGASSVPLLILKSYTNTRKMNLNK